MKASSLATGRSNADTLLSLDPGERTGWAYWVGDQLHAHGTERMGSPPDLSRLWRLLQHHRPHRIAWEEPQGMRGMGLVRIQRYLGVMELYAQVHAIPYASVSQGELKRHATGSGGAKKPEMIAVMEARHGISGLDDDQADAIAVGGYALECLRW